MSALMVFMELLSETLRLEEKKSGTINCSGLVVMVRVVFSTKARDGCYRHRERGMASDVGRCLRFNYVLTRIVQQDLVRHHDTARHSI